MSDENNELLDDDNDFDEDFYENKIWALFRKYLLIFSVDTW